MACAVLAAGVGAWVLFQSKPDALDPGLEGSYTTLPPTPETTGGIEGPEDEEEGQANPISDPLRQAALWKEAALEAAKEIVETFPDHPISHALLGSAFFNIGQSAQAVESLERCLELDSKQNEAYDMLARISYERGELEESIRLCRQAIRNSGANRSILNRMGRAMLDLGRSEEAIETLAQVVGHPQAISEDYYLLGQAYLQAGKPEQAFEGFTEAVKLMPGHTQAYFGLFTACARLGRNEDADKYRRQFLQLEEMDRKALTDRSAAEDTLSGLPLVRQTAARTFFGAGQIYSHHGQYAPAVDHLTTAARMDPGNAPCRSALINVLIRQDAPDLALQALRSLIALQPENGLNYYYLGKFHEHLNEFEAAERAYQKTQELAPDWPDGYRALIEWYLKSDREPAKAKELALRLLQLEPESGPNYYLVAFSSIRNNDRSGAISAMEKAVQLSPDNPRFQDFLGQLKASPAISNQ